MIPPIINGYKYAYTRNSMHIFYKVCWFDVKIVEVTTEQVKDGTLNKLTEKKKKR